MNRQEYKEAAEKALEKATVAADRSAPESWKRAHAYTDVARVYAMLAALPEVQDAPPYLAGDPRPPRYIPIAGDEPIGPRHDGR